MKLLRLICRVCLLMLLAISVAHADAAPQVKVRAHLEPAGAVVAGSQIKLVVDCLTTTWFTEAPDWPLFELPGAIVSLPDEQAENLHEVIDGVDWFGVSRAYRIVPQTARAFEIAPFAITVHPGQTSGPVQVMTPVQSFTATVPPGAEGMRTFFPTQKLTATQHIESPQQPVRVGDRITRTVTQRASGTQSMLIPPVVFAQVAGLEQDPRHATTRDIVEDRAGLVAGERTDTVSYRVERAGTFELPALSIEWWNTASQRKETIVLPAVSVRAIAAAEKPVFSIPVDSLTRGAAHRIIVIDRQTLVFVGLGLLAMLACVWAFPRLLRWRQRLHGMVAAVRRRHADGPGPAWRALQRATREGVPQQIIPALYRWMDKSDAFQHPATLNQPEGQDGLGPLREAVNRHYAGVTESGDQWRAARDTLRRGVKRGRKTRGEQSALPPLNKY
ncbi:BatD family protein [Paraburkholderia sp. DHOC27]|uniref:BatD family protein n=1 Tax=Paraburkholderia sp. DHOC27 TaxID=2303330 RepID=UPI000E3D0F10|nr:BatD family protein [Paraburkholderia sp. DHOC27]RFU48969.1 hypothetical protein D0B32_03850 [Paraburkholderia sp. DHOC27]